MSLGKKYFHKGTGYSFTLPRVYRKDDPEVQSGEAKEGSLMLKKDPMTGVIRRSPDGATPLYVKETFRFEQYPGTTTIKEGLWCFFEVQDNTPQTAIDYLDKLLADRKSGVTDYDGYIKERNPERFREIQMRRITETQLSEKNKEIARLQEELRKASEDNPRRTRTRKVDHNANTPQKEDS